jgi:hypothetical protein
MGADRLIQAADTSATLRVPHQSSIAALRSGVRQSPSSARRLAARGICRHCVADSRKGECVHWQRF